MGEGAKDGGDHSPQDGTLGLQSQHLRVERYRHQGEEGTDGGDHSPQDGTLVRNKRGPEGGGMRARRRWVCEDLYRLAAGEATSV